MNYKQYLLRESQNNLGVSSSDYKDISNLFPSNVMKAYIPYNKNALKILSVPTGEDKINKN